MSSKISSIDAWTLARDRYIEDLTEDEKRIYSTATLENLYYNTSAAEKTHQATSNSRAFVSKLQPFCAAIEQYGEAIDVYANASSLILCPLWGSVRVVLHLAREFGEMLRKAGRNVCSNRRRSSQISSIREAFSRSRTIGPKSFDCLCRYNQVLCRRKSCLSAGKTAFLDEFQGRLQASLETL